MAKSADPVQAARKAAIKREAKRNRERKEQAQEARTLRRDTSALERHIHRLESRQATLSQDDQEELKRLQAEVANIKRIKEDYIRKHPDQRNFVRGYEDNQSSSSTHADSSIGGPNRSSSTSQPSTAGAGAPKEPPQTSTRDPRWSIYYDPVFNPYGAPPPGMPYLEKSHAQLVAEGLLDAAKLPPLPEETAEFVDAGTDVDSDDSSVDDDLKDIVMPVGPPPSSLPLSALDRKDDRKRQSDAEAGRGRRQPPSRDGRRGQSRPHHLGGRDGPHHHRGDGARPVHSSAGLPPRPPTATAVHSAPPMNATSASSSPARAPASGPAKPPGPPPSIPDGVVISAEPQLRDFKKESTAFVPAALRKKQLEEKERMKRGLPGKINAAPISEEMSSSSAASSTDRPDLLKTLQAHLPSKDSGSTNKQGQSSDISKQEYEHFLGEVGDLL